MCPGEDTDYGNLVACHPKEGHCAFGVQAKGSWPSPEDNSFFLSPLRPDIEERFRFRRNGTIEAANEGDLAAEQTIRRLKLDGAELVGWRREFLAGAIPKEPRERARLLRQLEASESKLNAREDVMLREYSFALRQILTREVQKDQYRPRS